MQQPYRTKEEVEKQKHRDPIAILSNRLREIVGLTDDDLKEMDERALEQVAAALKFAEESPQPDPSELFTDVVAEHGPVSVNHG